MALWTDYVVPFVAFWKKPIMKVMEIMVITTAIYFLLDTPSLANLECDFEVVEASGFRFFDRTCTGIVFEETAEPNKAAKALLDDCEPFETLPTRIRTVSAITVTLLITGVLCIVALSALCKDDAVKVSLTRRFYPSDENGTENDTDPAKVFLFVPKQCDL